MLRRSALISACVASLGALACNIDGLAIWADGGWADGDTAHAGVETDTGDGTEVETGETPSDLPDDPQPTPAPSCSLAPEQLDGALPCELEPPSSSIAPVVAWTWTGPAGEDSVLVTPLVANLDDDNLDGFVDVCDRPDIVVAAVDLPPNKLDVWPLGHLHVLDGSGTSARMLPPPIDAAVNPALADLDGDGVAEIIAAEPEAPNSPYELSLRRLIALRVDGSTMWTGEHWQLGRGGGAIAIADLDGDEQPEILAPEYVANADGSLRWQLDDPPLAYAMPLAVDLDGDGQLEVMFGGTAYDLHGVKLFDTPTVPPNRGSVAVANFDDDDAPEIYVQYDGAHGVLEHDGSVLAECPTGSVEISGAGGYPVAIHDIDDDGIAELLFGYQDRVYVLAIDNGACVVQWSRKIDTIDGLSSGTLFDLLGDGRAEAIYADRSRVRLYAGDGTELFQIAHTARESIANPIVADVDGDGAAEIVIVSSEPTADSGTLTTTPTVTVIQNGDDHFASARRVWNQHTYHHSNVAELGRVPVQEQNWTRDNGFRTNRRVSAGEQCIPPWLAP